MSRLLERLLSSSSPSAGSSSRPSPLVVAAAIVACVAVLVVVALCIKKEKPKNGASGILAFYGKPKTPGATAKFTGSNKASVTKQHLLKGSKPYVSKVFV